MRTVSPALVHGVLQALGVALVAVGAAMYSLPLGLVVAGLGVVGLSVAAELAE